MRGCGELRTWPFLAALLVGFLTAGGALAQDREALLLDGKTTLHQRILTRPGAIIREAPSADAEPLTAPPPFSVYYVFDRQAGSDSGPGGFVEIGPSPRGEGLGWIEARRAVDWRQMLVLAFAKRSTRQRALFFGEADDLLNLIESELSAREAEEIYQSVARRQIPPFIVAIEPPAVPDFNDHFYLLPIFDHIPAEFDVGERTRVLQVASVTEDETGPPAADDERARERMARGEGRYNPALKDLRTGIAFVIDTTQSMGPYIERTRETVRRILDQLAEGNLGDKVGIALIGFRDNIEGRSGLDYVTRVFADFKDDQNRQEILATLDRMTPATVSSRGFEEDAFAGVATAVRDLDWGPYGKRYIVLITDAAPRRAGDDLGETGMGETEMRQLAAEKDIVIRTFHLLTGAGKHTHGTARDAYTALSQQDDPRIGSLYFGVDAGSVGGFGEAVDTFADAVASGITRTAEGTTSEAPEPPANDDPLARLKYQTDLVGRAMELDYLGEEAPSFYYAWVADRDLVDPSIPSLEVRVLMTRNQLSALSQALNTIIQTAEATALAPASFFDQLKSAVATAARDPNLIGRAGFTNLRDTGLFGEFLDDLPYRSKLLSIDQDLWSRWSVGEQQEFLDELDSKLALFRRFYEDTDNWQDLGGGDPADAVFPVPLEALP